MSLPYPYLAHSLAEKAEVAILVVEDEVSHAEAMLRSLKASGWTNVEVVTSLHDFRMRCVASPPAIALVDLILTDGRATELLIQPTEEGLFPIIIMTSHGDEKIVMEVMKNGAFDYLVKSEAVFLDLPRILNRSLREWALKHERIMLMNEAKAIYDLSIDMICIADLNGYFLRLNPAFQRTLGYTAEELYGKPFIEFVHPDDCAKTLTEFSLLAKGGKATNFGNRYHTKSGEYRWLEWNALLAPQGDVIYAVARDVSERKRTEKQIQHLAFYDQLTDLPNRQLLQDRLKQALVLTGRNSKHSGLLFIDVDNFKNLNDTLGHDMGDMLLQQVAQRLTFCTREGDTVARLGGDEFVVLLLNLSEQALDAAAQARVIGEKMLAAIDQPYQLEQNTFRCTASIGAAVFGSPQPTVELPMKQADIAMYQAKNAGRNTLRLFDHQMQEKISERVSLEIELQRALELQQFQLYYQPQVDSLNRTVGAEALIRWRHPVRGLVPPIQLITLAEETGLILPIGLWVLETACTQIKAWQVGACSRDLVLSINVSAKQFHLTDFVAQVQAALQRHAINPKLLKLELTESVLQDNTEETIGIMRSLNKIGVAFSLDDFGTGYSSLQYLKRLPLDELKIDQSFVRDIDTDSNDKTIVSTIIAMSKLLGLGVIAEGVETLEQRQFLLDNGCTRFQGYLFGKPLPIEQFDKWLTQVSCDHQKIWRGMHH
ncbi:MAG: diguanylate cyclase (GGDEF)-like protein/PAS domain S-box-containing protein [Cellvibrionaceae bacterium]|jgi:diguanylate cyclase (GGDEF)-like protein/PAS domain S-box-containing protein